MLFTELIQAVYPHLRGERNTAAFMRDMLERLSAVPEELWYSKRGGAPAHDRKDETLRKYFNRGISKTLARKMLQNPTRENFVDSLNYVNNIETESAYEVKAALAISISPFTDSDVHEGNVGDILFDLFQQAFEYIVKPELENDRKLQQAQRTSSVAKGKYGSRLLEECKFTSSQNGCGQYLQVAGISDYAEPLYQIAQISGTSIDYKNLIALCPRCFHAYTLSHNKSDELALEKNKEIQTRVAATREISSTVDIESGIAKVIEELSNAKLQDFEPLSFEPVAIRDKIDETVDFFIYDEVMHHVTKYFRFIERQMQEEARLKTFDDNLLRAQIKALSRKLTDKGYSKIRIHSDLSERLSQITKQHVQYCAFVISYFVQSCEVFDATT